MGICFAMHSLSDRNIEKVMASPALMWRLIAPDEPGMYLDEIGAGKKSFWARLFGGKQEDVDIPELEFIEGENVSDDLDKSWQGIHYCLNGTEYDAEPPMDFITMGGMTAGDVDVGYGPARLFDSRMVREIHERISGITGEQLHSRYDPEAMEKMDIYPNIWVSEGEEGFEYIEDYFENLKAFIADCVKHQLGMAVYFC